MRSLVVCVLIVLGLTACADQTGADVNPVEVAAATTLTDELAFTAPTLDEETFEGTSLAGKDAVVWFWAPWCTQCRREAPLLAKSQSENPEVAFLGVAGLGETGAMRDFVDDYGLDAFEHVADLDGNVWQRFGVVQQPAYAFIDSGGTIEVVRGELGEDGISEHLATLTGS